MTIPVSKTELLLRLAMPVAILAASIIGYLAITQPYQQCVNGRIQVQKSIGSVDESFVRSAASFECYTKH